MAARIELYFGDKKAYTAAAKDPNGLYFLTNGELYRGSTRVATGCVAVNTLPANDVAGQNILYVLPTGEAKVFDGANWTTVVYPTVSTVDDETAATAIPNVGAVQNVVQEAIANSEANVGVDDASIDKTTDNKLEIKGIKAATTGQQIRVKTVNGVNTVEFFTPSLTEEKAAEIVTNVENITNTVNELKPTVDDLSTEVAALKTGKADKSDTYTKSEVDALVNSTMQYKGDVATKTDLENIENPSTGDIYQVTEEHKTYIYDGTQWNEYQGGNLDLTNYVTKDELAPISTVVTTMPTTMVTEVGKISEDASGITLSVKTATKGESGFGTPVVSNIIIGAADSTKAGLMTPADKAAIDGIATGESLPTASDAKPGAVKVDGSTITIVDGTISVAKMPHTLTIGAQKYDGSADVTVTPEAINAYTKEETDANIQDAIDEALSWKTL